MEDTRLKRVKTGFFLRVLRVLCGGEFRMVSSDGGLMRMFCRTAILLALGAAALAAQSTSKQLPPPFQTPSADNRPQVIPQPNGAAVKVPGGFTVGVAAGGFDTPRFMLLGPGGEILMSDSGR